MNTADVPRFTELLSQVHAFYRQDFSEFAGRVWLQAMRPFEFDAVADALNRHCVDPNAGQFMPKPADVVRLLGGLMRDGRPGAEEAWAIALKARDEAVTVVLTDEIAEAMSAARPVLDAGDEVGARMAFRELYQRLIESARDTRTPVHWFPSLGTDVSLRSDALAEAARRGLLPRQHVAALLPPPEPTDDPQASRDGLERVRQAILDIDRRHAQRQVEQIEARRQTIAAENQRKREIAAQVAAYQEARR